MIVLFIRNPLPFECLFPFESNGLSCLSYVCLRLWPQQLLIFRLSSESTKGVSEEQYPSIPEVTHQRLRSSDGASGAIAVAV